VTYRVYEIPLNLQYKVVRLNEKSSIGGILGCSFFLTYDPALFGAMENRITRYNKELKETGILDYLIQRDAYHEIGFGLNAGVFYKLKLTKNLDLMSNAQYSLGLKPGATFFFLYEISDSTNKTYGDAVSYSNWDNISMTVSILYNLRKRNNKR
ncbi:MAG TPA: hypothetical protein PKC40_03465, partial [Saprospiraceae bacterium]|nr:hypothetical protein [Saprospiraceae bacterium]